MGCGEPHRASRAVNQALDRLAKRASKLGLAARLPPGLHARLIPGSWGRQAKPAGTAPGFKPAVDRSDRRHRWPPPSRLGRADRLFTTVPANSLHRNPRAGPRAGDFVGRWRGWATSIVEDRMLVNRPVARTTAFDPTSVDHPTERAPDIMADSIRATFILLIKVSIAASAQAIPYEK